MPDKAEKKRPEIVQPRPDIVLPDDGADSDRPEMRRAPAPRGEAGREER